MELERAIMHRFVELIGNNEPLVNPALNRIQVYQDMVHYRFAEVIRNTMPIFTSLLEREQLNALIFDFINSDPASAFIWKMPGEFAAYVLSTPLANTMPWLADLFWLEYTEVELLMQPHPQQKQPFSWEKRYRLNSSAKLRTMEYAVYKKAFTTASRYPVLLYYHFKKGKVYFDELTPFMAEFLTMLTTLDAEETCEQMAERYGASAKEMAAIIEPLLKKYCKKQILTEV